jgi:hypothetical protein
VVWRQHKARSQTRAPPTHGSFSDPGPPTHGLQHRRRRRARPRLPRHPAAPARRGSRAVDVLLPGPPLPPDRRARRGGTGPAGVRRLSACRSGVRTWPGSTPVKRPPSRTSSPLTRTCIMPSASWRGSSQVAMSRTSDGSNTSTSVNTPRGSRRDPSGRTPPPAATSSTSSQGASPRRGDR